MQVSVLSPLSAYLLPESGSQSLQIAWQRGDTERITSGTPFGVLSAGLGYGGVGRTRPGPALRPFKLEEGRTTRPCLFQQS